MRLIVITRALVAASAMLACGGGTPPPSDESAASNTGSGKGPDPAPAPEAANSGDPLAAAASTAPAPAAPAASGELGAAAGGGDDPWMASHQMTPKDVLHAVRPAQGKAQACFRAGVKRDPSTSGEVKIKFVISNDGAVRVWRDEGSSMTDGDVTKCVGDLIKSLKFPKQKSPGDAWGVYSINFTE
jgi:hypothetical protein